MRNYDTLSETMNALRNEGYTKDFNLPQDIVEYRDKKHEEVSANSFKVDKYYRFEGASNPSDSAILYAISSTDTTEKGLLVNAYGIYSDAITDDFIKSLDFSQE